MSTPEGTAIPPPGTVSRALLSIVWSIAIICAFLTALLLFTAKLPGAGHIGGDTSTSSYSVGWTEYDIPMSWLSLACAFSATLLVLALSITTRQFSLRRLVLLTFAIGAAGLLPQMLLQDYRDNARISLISKQPVPSVILERLKQRAAPQVALATLPDAMLAELGPRRDPGVTVECLIHENGIVCDLLFERGNHGQNSALREFYAEYLARVLDQEMTAAGLPAPGIMPTQRGTAIAGSALTLARGGAGQLFWKHEKAWRAKYDKTAPGAAAPTSASR